MSKNKWHSTRQKKWEDGVTFKKKFRSDADLTDKQIDMAIHEASELDLELETIDQEKEEE
jgi:hypothetical protein